MMNTAQKVVTLLSNRGSFGSYVTSLAPVLWYKMNETSGTVATNSGTGGAALNGTYVNAPTLGGDTLMGQPAAIFDGTADFVQFPATNLNAVFSPTEGSFVIAVRFSQAFLESATTGTVVNIGVDATTRVSVGRVTAGVFFLINRGGTASQTSILATTSADFNKYMFIASTWSQSGSAIRIYARGVTDTTAYPGGTWSGTLANIRSVIAAVSGTPATLIPGTLGQAMVFNRALNLSEIANLYTLLKAAEPNAV